MPHKKESAPTVQGRRASVQEHRRIIPQDEWERMCDGLPWLFVAAGLLWLIWEAVAWA